MGLNVFVPYDEVARASKWLQGHLGETIHHRGRAWRLHGLRGAEAILADTESTATRTMSAVSLWKRLSDAAVEPHTTRHRGETRVR